MKDILHITNWYPNKWDDLQGIFIKEQFNVFSEVTCSYLINIQVRSGNKLFEYHHIKYTDSEEGYYILTKIKSNKIIEVLTTILLLFVLYKSNYKKYDLLHVHIAYPLLIHYFIWKRIIKLPVIISEHWSAYHFNFYMPKKTTKLNSIKKIFKQKIPIITVSHALIEDIQEFSGVKYLPKIIIPNVIDHKYFFFKKISAINKIPVFFVVNNWRAIKNPFPILDGFNRLASKGIMFQLNIGGYGELIDDMKGFVSENKLATQVSFLGKMDKKQISNELAYSDAYLFSSVYETFSVVSAQALCCGVPLIGPRIPAILEYTNSKNYLPLAENNAEEWEKNLNVFIKNIKNYDRKEIAKQALEYLSHENIKKSYKLFLNKYV